ncbi:hypothetical protein Tco_0123143 [Tanacetum coccineum]
MDGFVTNDQADYYSGITTITVNGKNAFELKGKFFDDLLNNAFSGTNGEDTVEHIDNFVKIVDPIKLLNVQAIRDPSNSTFEKWLASKFANHMMTDPFTKKVLWDFWINSDDQERVVDEGFSDAEEANNDDEQEIVEIIRIKTNLFDYETPLCIEFKEFNFLLKVDPELFTYDIERTKTYEDYENELNDELEEPWSEDGVTYEICSHIYEPFCFKNGKAKWPTCNLNEDKFYNGGELSGMVRRDHIQGQYANFFTTYDPHLDINSIFGINTNASNMSNVEEEERNEGCNLFNNTAHNAPVCKIRRFEIIKYSFEQDEEYVAIKECEYDDLTINNEDACCTYQEIFHSMDEGWMVFLYRDLVGKDIDNVGEVSINRNPVCVVVMLEFIRIYNTHSCS